jgi:hypothetical protein
MKRSICLTPLILALLCACGQKPAEPQKRADAERDRPPGTLWVKRLNQTERYKMAREEAQKLRQDPLTTLDFGKSRVTREGRYRVTVQRPDDVPLNAFQTWVVHVETMDGKPVTGASLTINGGMPQHGHDLPTRPRMTKELGNGDYRVEGIQFSMPGWWEFQVRVDREAAADTAIFNLALQ